LCVAGIRNTVNGPWLCKLPACHCEEPMVETQSVETEATKQSPRQLGIAHLHCTERSAVQEHHRNEEYKKQRPPQWWPLLL